MGFEICCCGKKCLFTTAAGVTSFRRK